MPRARDAHAPPLRPQAVASLRGRSVEVEEANEALPPHCRRALPPPLLTIEALEMLHVALVEELAALDAELRS